MLKAHLPGLAFKLLRFPLRLIVPSIEICVNSELPIARHKVCTNPRFNSKGSYGEGESKNVNIVFEQKAHLPGRASKLLRFLQRRIVPCMKICANSELLIARYSVCTKERYI